MTIKRPASSYRLMSLILFTFWLVHAIWQALKCHQLDYLWQRLGLTRCSNLSSIWIHAASVGEVEMIKPLVEQLQLNHPILVTTFTATGYQHAQRIFPPQVLVKVIPIDFLPTSRHFIQCHQFKLALIAETELWPETLYQARKKNIPLLQINARLSSKSLDTSEWIKQVLQTTLGYFDLHLTRSHLEQDNLISMGVEKNKIKIIGNLKVARQLDAETYENLIDRPYILFASTHKPEEMIFAQLIKDLKLKQLCVIAPRHPVRATEILKSLKPLKLNIKQRSQGNTLSDNTELYLADTLGELKSLMAHSLLVIMGGSFAPIGGHNVLEPASLAKPVISGPSDDNIQQDMALLLKHDAIIQVNDADELRATISSLLEHPERLEQLSHNAAGLVKQQGHVLKDYLKAIRRYL